MVAIFSARTYHASVALCICLFAASTLVRAVARANPRPKIVHAADVADVLFYGSCVTCLLAWCGLDNRTVARDE